MLSVSSVACAGPARPQQRPQSSSSTYPAIRPGKAGAPAVPVLASAGWEPPTLCVCACSVSAAAPWSLAESGMCLLHMH